MTDVVMRAEEVHKRFGRLEVLKGVSLDVQQRETVCIIGPSGSGKTTFIRCINHLEKIDGGRITVNGHLIGYRQRGDGKLEEDSEKSPRSDCLTRVRSSTERSGSTIRLLTSSRCAFRRSWPRIAASERQVPSSVFRR